MQTYNSKQVAEILQCCVRTAYKAIKTIPHFKVGNELRVSKDVLEKYINGEYNRKNKSLFK